MSGSPTRPCRVTFTQDRLEALHVVGTGFGTVRTGTVDKEVFHAPDPMEKEVFHAPVDKEVPHPIEIMYRDQPCW